MTQPVNLTIDGQQIEATAGQTVLEAATAAGIDIPTLCHHPALEPMGACRICLIEISPLQPLHPACTYGVTQGLEIQTHSPRVEKARRFVLELLFSERNHYCMYCEMSGDCELQDLGYRYGLDHWIYPTYAQRFPLDATREFFLMDHNRCVLCRRCVRACVELVANHTLGVRGRGARTMVSADMDLPFGESSCVSCGTCLQVCPTGALVDKRSAFMGRNLQFERTPSRCSQCSIGCGMEIVTRGAGIVRLEGTWDALPNGGLLCQKGRFDPLTDGRQRVTQPLIRRNGELKAGDWDEALEAAARRLSSTGAAELAVLTSSNATNEALYLLSALFARKLGTANVALLNGATPVLLRPQGSLADLAASDVILVVGVDPAADQPVASFLVKRAVDRGARLIVVDGEDHGLAPFASMTLAPSDVARAVEIAARADCPVVLYGAGLPTEATRALAALDKALFVALEPGINTRAAVALGLNKAVDPAGMETLYILLGEEAPEGREALADRVSGAFTIVQTSYTSAWTERADIVLPMATWPERSGSLTNSEGRVLAVNRAVEPQGEARPDWQILSLLAGKLDPELSLPLEELSALAARQIG